MNPMQMAMLRQLMMQMQAGGGQGMGALGQMMGGGGMPPQQDQPMYGFGGQGQQPPPRPQGMPQGMGMRQGMMKRGGAGGGIDYAGLRQQMVEAARARGQGMIGRQGPGMAAMGQQGSAAPDPRMMMSKAGMRPPAGGQPGMADRQLMMNRMMRKG